MNREQNNQEQQALTACCIPLHATCRLLKLGWPEPYITGVYTVFLTGIISIIIYGSGQPYSYCMRLCLLCSQGQQ
jgi:hypothetical protein